MAPEVDEGKPLPPQHGETQLHVIRCGQQNHEVRIHRRQWPPQGLPRANEPEGPYLTPTCRRCGATVPVSYDPETQKPRQRKVIVILYGDPHESVGMPVVEEPMQVIEESALPSGGSVIEESEPKPRRVR